jgi:hypothetical protein
MRSFLAALFIFCQCVFAGRQYLTNIPWVNLSRPQQCNGECAMSSLRAETMVAKCNHVFPLAGDPYMPLSSTDFGG